MLKDSEDEDGVKRQGIYQKHTAKDKATISNYAFMHRMSATLCHFKNKFPDLKYMTVCEWRKVIIVAVRKNHEVVTELGEKERKEASNAP